MTNDVDMTGSVPLGPFYGDPEPDPTPTPTRPLLWEVMYNAYDQSTSPSGLAQDWADHHGYAAEIRAIADWLEAMWAAQGPPANIPMEFVEGLSIGMKIHREGALNILRAEANRAEAGE
jgi:hypothetical protein